MRSIMKRDHGSGYEKWLEMAAGVGLLGHKFEQAVNIENGAVVAVMVQTMNGGDTASPPTASTTTEKLGLPPSRAICSLIRYGGVR